jgi:hypothetical protein
MPDDLNLFGEMLDLAESSIGNFRKKARLEALIEGHLRSD